MIHGLLERAGGGSVTLAAFLVVLGIIIFVHEFGHFAVAKLFGIRVLTFSFGFGKRLWGFRRGDTDYRLSLVPLGGYVKLQDELEDTLTEGTTAQGDGRDFLARPRWQRFLVYLAGPVMNAVLTFVLLVAFYMVGVYEPSEKQARPIVGAVEVGLPAAQAGIEAGDEIVAVDGRAISRWEELRYTEAVSAGRSLRLKVRREGAEREVEVRPVPVGPDHVGQMGVSALTYILRIDSGVPAERAGLRVDDAIVRVGGSAVSGSDDVLKEVAGSGGRALQFRVLREGRFRDVAVTPEDRGQGLRIGVMLGPQRVLLRLGPIRALSAAAAQTGRMTLQVVDILGRLVTGRLSVRTLGGPIRIAQMSGDAARQGGDEFFMLIAYLSINVGILNLLPLVPLDGGHLLLLSVEGAARRDLSLRVKTWLMNAGAALVFGLIAFVVASDLAKQGLFGRFWR